MLSYPGVKINLGLSVLRKREDGFHDLETVFYPFDGFHDTLEIEEAGSFSVKVSGPFYTGWNPEGDLVARACGMLQADFGIPPVSIRLEKTSPVGAGLGGGSSDGVEALKMLNGMFGLGLSSEDLLSYARRLGSDCAFFVTGRPALAEGRGDVLHDIDVNLDNFLIRVEIPAGVAVSTKEAYSGVRPHEPAVSLREAISRPVGEWKDCLHNDFEDSIFPLHPEIGALKEKLYEEGAVYASMSGSGSAVYGIFRR